MDIAKIVTYAISFAIVLLLQTSSVVAQSNCVSFVDPFIGTGGHGHTFPGATMPFGMVQLSPDTRLDGWDGCSGYHFSDSVIYGFSHTHLSGTGVSDYGDVLLMPSAELPLFHNGADGKPGYSSPFRKETEVAYPGYYSVILDKSNIAAKLTATPRTGLHAYTFPDKGKQYIMLDLVHRDKVTDSYIELVNDYEIRGYRHSTAWAEEQYLYFHIQSNQPISDMLLQVNGQYTTQPSAKNQALRAAITFENTSEELMLQVGISAVDMDGAQQNLQAEFADWDFLGAVADCSASWESELSKIQIEDPDLRKKKIFYSALYHTMLAPNLFTDVDGRYRGTDHDIHTATEHTQYTVFSLWDTYRATHPLYTIIDQRRTKDYIYSFLQDYKHGGRLPMWELAGNYTNCMIGYHAVPVIADAYIKGIRGFDADYALEAMLESANADRFGIARYRKQGFLAAEDEAESVSKTLEYAYDDWTISLMAAALGKDSIAQKYGLAAQNYKNVYDPNTGFMRARQNNSWFNPFDPAEVNFNYTEANCWQYSYSAVQDIGGWTALLGGPRQVGKKLDALFAADSQTSGRDQADITGLIGQYAHGNEPSHHIAYLYNYIGQPNKTQHYVRKILDELYSDAPDGLSGNEDCGQMSTWLVMSALGFYPVAPGSEQYAIGSPWFKEATIRLENGKIFQLSAPNNSPTHKYIASIMLNQMPYGKTYIKHTDIMQGGVLEFEMSAASSDFGSSPNAWPSTRIEQAEMVAVPCFTSGARTFADSTKLTLNCATTDADIYYILNNDGQKRLYTQPFHIQHTAEITVFASKQNAVTSTLATAKFTKVNSQIKLNLGTQYGQQYSAGGNNALINSLRGNTDFRTGNWQGYEGVDIVATLDLGQQQAINELSMGFLQDENSWIFMPTEVQYYTSNNGKKFKKAAVVTSDISPKDKGVLLYEFTSKINKKARFIKVIAKNRGTCPPYHKGAGYQSWIFADEISLKF